MITANSTPSLSSLLVNHQRPAQWAPTGYFVDLPFGRKFFTDPNAPVVRAPGISKPRPRWFARLMGIFG